MTPLGRSLFLVATLIIAATLAGSAGAADWPRVGGDAQLTNDVPTETAEAIGMTPANASALQIRWRANLDGGLVASPLYLGANNAVYVATEAGSVYALSAGDGSVIWHRSFPTHETLDCGTYGISSTGVIDETRGRLYVATADGDIHALSLATGADAAGWPLAMPLDPTTAYVWGGLTLVGGSLYVPVSSFCDEPDPITGVFPEGGLSRIDVATARVDGGFSVSGPGTLGGIWGYGGTSVDPLTGDLWTATGNSEPLGEGETQGFAEAIVQLSPSLDVVGWNRPPGIPTEALDTDFGSTPVLFQPLGCPPLAAAFNKNGELYVWNRNSVGAGPVWSMQIGPDDLETPFIGEPSWSPDTQMLYVANARIYDTNAPFGVARFDAAVGIEVGDGCSFPTTPTWIADAGQGTKPPPLVVGGLVFVAGGDATSLSVLDASTGSLLHLFFLENTLFSPPILAGDEVVLGNSGGTVFAIAPAAGTFRVNTARKVCLRVGHRATCAAA